MEDKSQVSLILETDCDLTHCYPKNVEKNIGLVGQVTFSNPTILLTHVGLMKRNPTYETDRRCHAHS